ncbi:MAG: TRAP transporter large permease [Lacrimispora saccharolytica]
MLLKIVLLFGTMFILMMIGSPIAVSLGAATIVTMVATTSIGTTTIATACFSGLDSFPLLAIPFFILAGNLMKSGGISRRLLDFADALVGHFTGSVGMVTVVASMFFAALSGSSPATVTSIGSITIPEMKEKGYDADYATALTAAAGTIGVIIPPSIPFVIYGVTSGASIADLFLAGVIPGIMIGLVLMAVNYFSAKKHGYDTKKQFHVATLWKAFKDAIWALLVPIIILGGIYGGIFTPTESAVAGIIYSLIVGVFVYKELDAKKIYEAVRETVLVNGQTTFLVGISMAFARFLTMSQVPSTIAGTIIGIDNKILVLLVINLFLLIVGCFIDNISSTVILTPILLPIVTGFGMDPVHFGIVMTVNLAIGFITPPYGCNLFFASAIAGVPIDRIAARIIPMILALIAVLMLLTFIPALSLALL